MAKVENRLCGKIGLSKAGSEPGSGSVVQDERRAREVDTRTENKQGSK